MEKQIVLRDKIEWTAGAPLSKYKGALTVGWVANSSVIEIREFTMIRIRIFGKTQCFMDGTLDEAKARAEELLLEFLNSIAQPEDILTVKEKD